MCGRMGIMVDGERFRHASDVAHGLEPLHLCTHPSLRVPCLRCSWKLDHLSLGVPKQLFSSPIQEEHALFIIVILFLDGSTSGTVPSSMAGSRCSSLVTAV